MLYPLIAGVFRFHCLHAEPPWHLAGCRKLLV